MSQVYFNIRNAENNRIWFCPTAALNNGKNVCQTEKVYEEQVVRMFRRAFIDRFDLVAEPVLDDVTVADIMSGRYGQDEERTCSFTQKADDFVSQIWTRLNNVQRTDNMERDRGFLKRQIDALQVTITEAGKRTRRLISEKDTLETRRNLLGDKRFNEMMKDALDGRMDYIVTKSISRFARNTIDTLDCVRQLRQLNPPVGIYFEKENIDTLDATGELILTILSALAQDESRSISDNIRWSIQRKFQRGEAMVDLSRMLGYDKGANGEWLINPEQAEIVRYIFDRFVCGASSNAIAKELNAMGKTTVKGSIWRADSVLYILRNEKYVGDCENQKYVTKNFLTHEATRNNGEVAKYYQASVDEEDFLVNVEKSFGNR